MKKKRIGIIALMLSSALIISASATISTVFKCSAAGIDYQAYSTLNTSSTAPNKLAGGGTVATVSKNTVPAGYMMIKSTIMTSNGEVVAALVGLKIHNMQIIWFLTLAMLLMEQKHITDKPF